MKLISIVLLLFSTPIFAESKPVPKPLPAKMDALSAARFDAALSKVREAVQAVKTINLQLAPAQAVIAAVSQQFSLLFDSNGNLLDQVDFTSGAITRAPRTAPPAEDPPKAAPKK